MRHGLTLSHLFCRCNDVIEVKFRVRQNVRQIRAAVVEERDHQEEALVPHDVRDRVPAFPLLPDIVRKGEDEPDG